MRHTTRRSSRPLSASRPVSPVWRDRAIPAAGLLSRWASSLGPRRAQQLFDELVCDDMALRAAMPALFDESSRVARCALLMLERCARERGMSAGELAALLVDPERDALDALSALAARAGASSLRAGS